MSLFFIDTDDLYFPPVNTAENDGLLAIGGDLLPDRLLLAYKSGIFPWYESEVPLWWCPDPRFVLFPEEIKIRKSVRQLLEKEHFEFTINKAFSKVIHHCRKIKRPWQEGTWIRPEVENAYCKMHELGYAHSAEVWKDGELMGGLYGIRLGKVFFGESMFSKVSDASRYAFIKYVEVLKSEGVQLIDCQIWSGYLESLGARMIKREEFIDYMKKLID